MPAGDTTAIWKAAADALVAGDDQTLARLLEEHDKMLRAGPPRSSWLGGLTPDFKDGDARTIVARHHFFATWEHFAEFTARLKDASSPVSRFERTVDAVISGDTASLEQELRESPDLARARSVRT